MQIDWIRSDGTERGGDIPQTQTLSFLPQQVVGLGASAVIVMVWREGSIVVERLLIVTGCWCSEKNRTGCLVLVLMIVFNAAEAAGLL